MSDAEKVVTILGAVTAAAFAAALAVGAFQSALSLGVAVVAITAGIAAMMMAINSAEKRVNPAELESKHIRRSLRPQRQHTRAGYRCSDPAEWGVPGGTGRPEEGPQPGGPGKPYPANCEGRERRRIERNPDHTSGSWTNPLPGL